MSNLEPVIGDGDGGSADEQGEPVEWEGPTRPDRPSNTGMAPEQPKPRRREPAVTERDGGDAVDDDTR
jgi:hypothetical protein